MIFDPAILGGIPKRKAFSESELNRACEILFSFGYDHVDYHGLDGSPAKHLFVFEDTETGVTHRQRFLNVDDIRRWCESMQSDQLKAGL